MKLEKICEHDISLIYVDNFMAKTVYRKLIASIEIKSFLMSCLILEGIINLNVAI